MKACIVVKTVWATLFFVFTSLSTFGQNKIVATGDEWYYYNEDGPPRKNWYVDKHIDAHWKSGISPLGYGDEVVKTDIGFGNDPKNKPITKYFKKTFVVNDPYQHLIYKLNVQRDDGIVIYLNGNEVMRNNMPAGTITDTTLASGLVFSKINESMWHTKLLSPDDLLPGMNTISASVHQGRSTSSDCIFNLELIGSNDSSMIPLLLKEQDIKSLSLEMRMRDYNHAQELENKDLQLELAGHSTRQFKSYFFISLALFLLSLIFFFYLRKNHAKKEIKLLSSIARLKELNTDKDREMIHLSLNSVNERQFLKEIKKTLEESLKTKDSAVLKRTLQNIDYHLDPSEDWENLKKHFNAVHAGYVDKLMRLHPSLTDIELRHCIFIKLHLQTKEIANMLHIDPRSVQASRYRIKKKMNLGENIDLKVYLLEV